MHDESHDESHNESRDETHDESVGDSYDKSHDESHNESRDESHKPNPPPVNYDHTPAVHTQDDLQTHQKLFQHEEGGEAAEAAAGELSLLNIISNSKDSLLNEITGPPGFLISMDLYGFNTDILITS